MRLSWRIRTREEMLELDGTYLMMTQVGLSVSFLIFDKVANAPYSIEDPKSIPHLGIEHMARLMSNGIGLIDNDLVHARWFVPVKNS